MIAAREHGATTKRTIVNGNEVRLWRFTNDREHNSEVRQAAAALPRDMDGLDYVDGSANHDALVWLDPCPGDEDMRSFEVPAPYTIAEVDHFSSGSICIGLEVEA